MTRHDTTHRGGDENETETANLQAVAKCVDPGIAELLPRLVPKNLLTVFKSRIAKRMVYSEGARPLEVRTASVFGCTWRWARFIRLHSLVRSKLL